MDQTTGDAFTKLFEELETLSGLSGLDANVAAVVKKLQGQKAANVRLVSQLVGGKDVPLGKHVQLMAEAKLILDLLSAQANALAACGAAIEAAALGTQVQQKADEVSDEADRLKTLVSEVGPLVRKASLEKAGSALQLAGGAGALAAQAGQRVSTFATDALAASRSGISRGVEALRGLWGSASDESGEGNSEM